MSSRPIIAIDARMWGTKHAGIGRYVEGLVTHLSDDFEYVLLVDPDNSPAKHQLPPDSRVVEVASRHYSINEQLEVPQALLSIKPDLVHVPHFNAPILYNGKTVVTIHDLLWHRKRGLDVTTLHPIKYLAKYLAYRLVVRRAITHTSAIITPSKAVKQEIQDYFPTLNPKKSHVIYEGVADSLVRVTPSKVPRLPKRFLLHLGSLYPHKRVESVFVLLAADPFLELILVSARSEFSHQMVNKASEAGLRERVHIMGHASDEVVAYLMSKAIALIVPSESEGFGLPGIEAMQLGCPVMAAKTPTSKEIYGDAAVFIDPLELTSWQQGLEIVTSLSKRSTFIAKGKVRAKMFRFDKMARETEALYRKVLTT